MGCYEILTIRLILPHHVGSQPSLIPLMSAEPYLAVLKASYDYDPQSDDEIAIKGDQLLFLIERVDDECVPFTFP